MSIREPLLLRWTQWACGSCPCPWEGFHLNRPTASALISVIPVKTPTWVAEACFTAMQLGQGPQLCNTKFCKSQKRLANSTQRRAQATFSESALLQASIKVPFRCAASSKVTYCGPQPHGRSYCTLGSTLSALCTLSGKSRWQPSTMPEREWVQSYRSCVCPSPMPESLYRSRALQPVWTTDYWLPCWLSQQGHFDLYPYQVDCYKLTLSIYSREAVAWNNLQRSQTTQSPKQCNQCPGMPGARCNGLNLGPGFSHPACVAVKQGRLCCVLAEYPANQVTACESQHI